ncbi:MAG: hypothetical protein IKP91_11110 [Bacteroidaceae bacterium]|nr:hypothetical protein [Bacteroidaceae bacterium]
MNGRGESRGERAFWQTVTRLNIPSDAPHHSGPRASARSDEAEDTDGQSRLSGKPLHSTAQPSGHSACETF